MLIDDNEHNKQRGVVVDYSTSVTALDIPDYTYPEIIEHDTRDIVCIVNVFKMKD